MDKIIRYKRLAHIHPSYHCSSIFQEIRKFWKNPLLDITELSFRTYHLQLEYQASVRHFMVNSVSTWHPCSGVSTRLIQYAESVSKMFGGFFTFQGEMLGFLGDVIVLLLYFHYELHMQIRIG
jgi:hypothetical protein